MENPFITRYDNCNDCSDGSFSVEKCYNGDPRFIAVTVPYAEHPLIFAKGTARVSNVSEACADACPQPSIKPTLPQATEAVVLTGEAIYAGEWGTDVKLRPQTVALTYANCTLAGTTYDAIGNFYEALNALIQNCDCACE